jgi:hypothetical protein
MPSSPSEVLSQMRAFDLIAAMSLRRRPVQTKDTVAIAPVRQLL